MRVIFLDIDGVLNVCYQKRDDYGQEFHPEFVENLRRIVEETGAHIVISSTWRMSGLDVMREMWTKRGLPGEVIGITPVLRTRHRGDEIQEWLRLNTVETYVILDDDRDMLREQLPKFVHCFNPEHPDSIDVGYGLTRDCAEMAILVLEGMSVMDTASIGKDTQ